MVKYDMKNKIYQKFLKTKIEIGKMEYSFSAKLRSALTELLPSGEWNNKF